MKRKRTQKSAKFEGVEKERRSMKNNDSNVGKAHFEQPNEESGQVQKKQCIFARLRFDPK